MNYEIDDSDLDRLEEYMEFYEVDSIKDLETLWIIQFNQK